MNRSTHRLLVCLLCSFMLISSHSSKADIGSGTTTLKIAASVAGAEPNHNDDPPVKAPNTATTPKKAKPENEAPLSDVAAAGRALGKGVTVSTGLSRALGLTRDAERVTANLLEVTVGDERRLLFVIKKAPPAGSIDIIVAFMTETGSTYYLTSPSGDLRIAVTAKRGAGGGPIEVTDEIRKQFQSHCKFWQGRVQELNADVKPNVSEIPRFKSVNPGTKKSKSEDETPLAGVARIGQSLGNNTDLSPSTVRLMSFGQDGEAVSARILDFTQQRRGRILYVVQKAPTSPMNLVFVNRAENDALMYLTSPRGDLEIVVRVQRGQPWRRVDITDALRRSFEEEKTFWLAKERELSVQPANEKK